MCVHSTGVGGCRHADLLQSGSRVWCPPRLCVLQQIPQQRVQVSGAVICLLLSVVIYVSVLCLHTCLRHRNHRQFVPKTHPHYHYVYFLFILFLVKYEEFSDKENL